jgi:hypothetical protein
MLFLNLHINLRNLKELFILRNKIMKEITLYNFIDILMIKFNHIHI